MYNSGTISTICTECDTAFSMHYQDTDQRCYKCRNKSDVAKCNTDNKLAIDFSDWINKMGGPSRVSRVMGVDRTTVYRHCTSGKIPPMWIKFMELSKELANYKEKFGKL